MTTHLNDDGTARLTEPDPQARALAIAHCHLCDDDGYRNGAIPCDHIDRTQTAQRGIAAVRAAMGWNDKSHACNPKSAPETRTAPGNGITTPAHHPPNDTNGHPPPTTHPAPHPEKI